MARKIVVTSGKGGVGKTTVTANLGAKLADIGNRVVLCDIDFGLNNLDVVTGVENRVVYDVIDVIEGRCRAKQALIDVNGQGNLFVLPSCHSLGASSVSAQHIKIVLDALSGAFDFILVDCPAGIDVGFHRAVSCTDEAIVVTTPHLSSLRDADKVISVLRSYRMEKVSLVVNRARGDLILGGEMTAPEEIEAILKIPLAGVVPEEDEVFLSSGGSYVTGSGGANKSFKMLAARVARSRGGIYNCTARYSGFFGSIKRSLKRSL